MPMKTKKKEDLAVRWGRDGLYVMESAAAEAAMLKAASASGGVLGLRFATRAEAIGKIRRGLDFGVMENLSRAVELPVKQLASLVSIAARTLARRKREGRLDGFESERVYRLAALFDRAVQVLGGEERARQWLKAPKKALEGKTPLAYSETELGAREVEDLLGRLEHGVFS